MLTSILLDLKEIPHWFMQQHGSFLLKGVNMTRPNGKDGLSNMGGVPLF
jgi:hypothetical protein